MGFNKIKPERVYFENLNAIRFIAAFLVIIHHIEQLKSIFGISNESNSKVILLIGKIGVILFFVLSGFLISYLLFKEKEVKGTISIKKFYIRRILRIWPLYFLIVFAALFLFPSISFFNIDGFANINATDNLFSKLILFIAFLPNLVLVLYGAIPFASQTWSIGAEEQFYLIWPVLNKKIKNKWLLIMSVIFGYILFKILLHLVPQTNFVIILNDFIGSAPIDCMAIGGLFALIIFENSVTAQKIKKIIFSKTVQFFTVLLILILVFNGFTIPFFNYEMYSILFGIMISNLAINENRIFSLENKLTNYLGKISYGLYMFHPIIIVIVLKTAFYFKVTNNYFIYPFVFLGTIFISSLSYDFFEKKFIDKKIKYTDIISGENAKTYS